MTGAPTSALVVQRCTGAATNWGRSRRERLKGPRAKPSPEAPSLRSKRQAAGRWPNRPPVLHCRALRVHVRGPLAGLADGSNKGRRGFHEAERSRGSGDAKGYFKGSPDLIVIGDLFGFFERDFHGSGCMTCAMIAQPMQKHSFRCSVGTWLSSTAQVGSDPHQHGSLRPSFMFVFWLTGPS